MRESIIIYDSWGRLICGLPDNQASELCKMVFGYSFNGTIPESDDATVNAMFSMIKEKLDEDAVAWDETRRRRSEGGKKGMASRWGNKSVITNNNLVIKSNNELSEAITPITVSESVSVSVSKDKESKRFTPPSREEVQAYITEKEYNVDADRFIDFYTAKGWVVGKSPMKDWKAAVRTWACREKDPVQKPSSSTGAQKNNKFNQYEQRNDYDFDALERALIVN